MAPEILEILERARQRSIAVALAYWERDQQRDAGTCGGAVLLLDARTSIARMAVDRGYAFRSGNDVFVKDCMPPGVRSQNADIWQNAMQAFRDELIASGHEKAIKKFWTYID